MGEYTPRIEIALPDDGEEADYDGEVGPQSITPGATGPDPNVNWIDSHQAIGFLLDETYIERGTLSNRPAAGATAPSFYLVTNGPTGAYLSWNTGSGWETISSGGGGGGSGDGSFDTAADYDVTGLWDFFDTASFITQVEPNTNADFVNSVGDGIGIRSTADGNISIVPYDGSSGSYQTASSLTWDPDLGEWDMAATNIDGIAEQTDQRVDGVDTRLSSAESNISDIQTALENGQELFQSASQPAASNVQGGDWWHDLSTDPSSLKYWDDTNGVWQPIGLGGTSDGGGGGGGTTYPILVESWESSNFDNWTDVTTPAEWTFPQDGSEGSIAVRADDGSSRGAVSLPGSGLPVYFGDQEKFAVDMKFFTGGGICEFQFGHTSTTSGYYYIQLDDGNGDFQFAKMSSAGIRSNIFNDETAGNYTNGTYYTLEVDRRPNGGESFNMWVHENGALKGEITGTSDATFSGNGLGFRSNNNRGQFDNFRKIDTLTFG